ncbi:hypothetical protein ACQW02_13395 [Humitalea sp. 24SJ18S-53]|uniref:hypothetical protein n=1 Tax=Humitalea sp. 24SJ18S-53 TaxID=3422307 RepID=UPI003D67C854
MSKRGYIRAEIELAQTAAFECTMMIWHTGAWAGALTHPGHASVLLRRDRDEGPFVGYQPAYDDDDEIRYVSFWPASASDKGTKRGQESNKTIYTSRRDGNFLSHHNNDYDNELGATGRAALENGGAPRAGQVVFAEYDNGNDYWGQRPQALIALPALTGMRATSLGLDMNRIVAWCVNFRVSEDFNYTYISTSQNCSGVAVRALCAGGGDAFAAMGGSTSKGTIYFTPNDAEVWGNSVALGIQRVNNLLADLHNLSHTTPLQGTDLLDVDAWKTLSTVAHSMRGSLTRAIDDGLATYHATTWGANYPKRMSALVKIIKNTHAHLQRDSRRNPAYLTLARQIMHVVGERAVLGNRAWDVADYYGSDHIRPAPKKTAPP